MKINLLIIIAIGIIGFTGIAFATHGNDGDHVGTLQWLKASYPASGTAVVRVIDPDMNLNPKKIDNFDVFVRSDSHAKGLYLTATETGVSTGVFEGTLFLSLEHLGTGHRLKVAEGDTITAEYDDNTLPASYTEGSLSIIAKSEIRPIPESPLKQSKLGITIDKIECKDGLVQVFKKPDNFPACVKPLTAEKLIQRGWVTSEDSESLNKRWGEMYLEYQSLKKSFPDNPDNMTTIERMAEIDNETMRIATILSEREFAIDVPGTSVRNATFTDSSYLGPDWGPHSEHQLPEQLKRVLQSCEQKRIAESTNYTWPDGTKYYLTTEGYEYSNATHTITNNTCEWQPIGGFESKSNIFLDIASVEENRIALNPTDTCAYISLRLLSADKLEQYHARDKEVQFFEITETDLEELPVLDELIQATHHLDFTTNNDVRTEMGLRELVDYEFFIMKKAIDKYDDSQDDYFIKLDGNLDEKLANPKPQGFSNEFLSPQIVYGDNVYVLSHTVFWVANEHETQHMSVHLQDSIDNDKKFITLTDEDMESIPKIKQAIEKIGTEFESIHARKGLPENPDWNEYREWFVQKKVEQFNLHETYVPGFVYNNEYYDLGFLIC